MFRRHYARRLEIAVAAGLVFHLALFALVPPLGTSTAGPSVEPPIPLIPPLAPEIQIPPPPPDEFRPLVNGLDLASIAEVLPPPIDLVVPEDVRDPFPPGNPGISIRPNRFPITETPPELVRAVEPRYPDLAQEAGAEGEVLVEVLVDPQGRVARARIVRSDAPRVLEEAALDAARAYLFRPARQQGYAVPATVVIPFRFALR